MTLQVDLPPNSRLWPGRMLRGFLPWQPCPALFQIQPAAWDRLNPRFSKGSSRSSGRRHAGMVGSEAPASGRAYFRDEIPMSSNIRILPRADADLDEQAEYIARDSVESAHRFYTAAEATFQYLVAFRK